MYYYTLCKVNRAAFIRLIAVEEELKTGNSTGRPGLVLITGAGSCLLIGKFSITRLQFFFQGLLISMNTEIKSTFMFICKTTLIAVVLLFSVATTYSQTDLKNWNTAQLNLSFTKKLNLRLSHLRAFDMTNGYNSDFNQSSAQLSYDLTKKLDVAAGYTFSGSNSIADGGSRISARLGYKIKIADVLSWSNAVQAEVHSKSETRYHYRIIYTTRLSPKKRLDFLNLSPSVSYSLFYNIGGSAIQYYDSKTSAPAIRQTPDGFHRGRFMFNLNSKVTEHFSLAVYYMMQREFNLFASDYRRMNITKPTTGRIVRAFDNFNVLGFTLQYDIDLYGKKK
jgi:hypothetical protein